MMPSASSFLTHTAASATPTESRVLERVREEIRSGGAAVVVSGGCASDVAAAGG